MIFDLCQKKLGLIVETYELSVVWMFLEHACRASAYLVRPIVYCRDCTLQIAQSFDGVYCPN